MPDSKLDGLSAGGWDRMARDSNDAGAVLVCDVQPGIADDPLHGDKNFGSMETGPTALPAMIRRAAPTKSREGMSAHRRRYQ